MAIVMDCPLGLPRSQCAVPSESESSLAGSVATLSRQASCNSFEISRASLGAMCESCMSITEKGTATGRRSLAGFLSAIRHRPER